MGIRYRFESARLSRLKDSMWQLMDAKNRFSELVEKALHAGPQHTVGVVQRSLAEENVIFGATSRAIWTPAITLATMLWQMGLSSWSRILDTSINSKLIHCSTDYDLAIHEKRRAIAVLIPAVSKATITAR